MGGDKIEKDGSMIKGASVGLVSRVSLSPGDSRVGGSANQEAAEERRARPLPPLGLSILYRPSAPTMPHCT